MPPNRRRLVTRAGAALFATAVLATAVLAVAPGATEPAGAQDDPSAFSRLVDLEGSCGPAALGISGSLALDLPAGAVVAQRYEVRDGSTSLDLGGSEVEASTASNTTTPYVDDIWFGPRWTTGVPFTYVQVSTVLVDGTAVYEQTLEAACSEAGSEAVITTSEQVPTTTTSTTTTTTPGGGGGEPVPPRYTA